MKSVSEKIILGIDPGTNVMGYGVISQTGNKIKLITYGVVMLKKFDNHYIKLRKIYERTSFLVDEYKPDELAIESPFLGKNAQSMLKLGRAQGVAMTAALNKDIPIFEYAPLKIKMAITGTGTASKEQVSFMLQKILNFKTDDKHLDATDGLAAAVCHSYQNGIKTSSKNSWADFIAKNPKRIK